MYYIGKEEFLNNFRCYFIEENQLLTIDFEKWKLFNELGLEEEFTEEIHVKDVYDAEFEEYHQIETKNQILVFDFQRVNMDDLNKLAEHYCKYNTCNNIEITDEQKLLINFLYHTFNYIEYVYEYTEVVDIENEFIFNTQYQISGILEKLIKNRSLSFKGKLIKF